MPVAEPPTRYPPPDRDPSLDPALIAVTGGKGGCGKTTTTLGVAAASAHAGESTLAVDADVDMPNLHLLSGVDRHPTLADGPAPDVAQQPAAFEGVEIVPAPVGTASVSAPALVRSTRAYERVVVDCPAGAGSAAVAPLRVADAAVLVTTLEPACLEDALRTTAMARALDTPVAGVGVSRAGSVPAGSAGCIAATLVNSCS